MERLNKTRRLILKRLLFVELEKHFVQNYRSRPIQVTKLLHRKKLTFTPRFERK